MCDAADATSFLPSEVTSAASHIAFDADSDSPVEGLPDEIHGLVYCPGTINLKPFHRIKEEEFLHDYYVNFLGAVRVLQAALPGMKKAGNSSVVLFSTVAVGTGLGFHASIASAKGAVEGLVRSLACEWSPRIRVNGVAPSLTDTPLAATLLGSEDKREVSEARHPLKRIGTAQEVAALAELLLSDNAASVTGQMLRPDGGLSSLRPL
ncbi:MAG: SDR family oxidoreductase [Verrucomicrobiota bacterium]